MSYTTHYSSKLKGAALAISLTAACLLLAGCIETTTNNRATEIGPGVVRVQSTLTAADESPQRLTEYGAFVSTNRDDIVAINGAPYMTNLVEDDFTVRPGVQTITVGPLDQQIAALQTNVLFVDVSGLRQNTTYYARLYTVGTDSSDMEWKFATDVVTFRTASNSDARLSALTVKYGKLNPTFTPSRLSYTSAIAAYRSQTTVTAKPMAPGARVRMRVNSGSWRNVSALTLSIAKGRTVKISTKVTSRNGAQSKIYTTTITRRSR